MEKIYYSPSTLGFYGDDQARPLDAIEISAEQKQALHEGQAAGGRIVITPEGVPVIEPLTQAVDYAMLRAMAYREESDPLFFKYQRGEVSKEVWLAKIDEIKQRYPD